MSGSRPRFPKHSRAIGATVAALPIVATLVVIQQLAVNVPYQDDWDMLPFVAHWHAGTLSVADFWEQHSEHRVVALKAAIGAIAAVAGFDVVAHMLAGFAIAVITFLLVADLLGRALREDAAALIAPLVVASSFLMFSLVQHENWLFATASLQLFLLNLCTVTLVWVMARWPERWSSVAIAAVCATIGMFTEVSGQLLWFTGAVAIAWSVPGARDRLLRLIVWAVTGCAMAIAYWWDLHWATSAVGAALADPTRVLLFAGACLGLPVGAWAGTLWCAVIGWEGCVILAAACRSLQRKNAALLRRLAPVLLLAMHGLLVSLLIAVGRAGGDPRSALTSHYAFGPTLFWIAVIVVTACVTLTAWPTPFGRRSGIAAVAFVCALLAVAYVKVNVDGFREAFARSRNLQMARTALLSSAGPSREVLRFLYPPDEERVRRLIDDLRRYRLGPFATDAGAEGVEPMATAKATESADGYLDGGDCTGTTGWAWDPADPDNPVMLDIWSGHTRIGTARADWFRWDLRAAGKGNGQHAFRFLFPTQTDLRSGQVVTVTFADTQKPIRGSPKIVPCRD